jgi:hypothetical protein
MWQPTVSGGAIDHENPLLGRELRCWIWPFGQTDGAFGNLRTGSELEQDALKCPEGLERAARDAKEQLRLLYVGCTRARQKLVFAHRAGQCAWLSRLADIDAILCPDLAEGEHALDGCDTTYVLRQLSADSVADFAVTPPRQTRWLASSPPGPSMRGGRELRPGGLAARCHSPSAAAAVEGNWRFESTKLSGKSFFPAKLDERQFCAIGHAVHAYLAALPSMKEVDQPRRNAVAARCIAAHAVSGLLPPSILVSAGERFQQWVTSTFPDSTWHVEVPISGRRNGGGQWIGTADLILQLPTEELVIIDHKSAPIRREQCQKKAAQYVGQLSAYSEVLTGAASPIHSAWIHFPLAGIILRSCIQ